MKQGRTRGTPNRIPAGIKAMIEGALEDVGGRAYLARQAEENPVAFLALLGKIIPREIRADVAATHTIARLAPDQVAGIAEAVLSGRDAA